MEELENKGLITNTNIDPTFGLAFIQDTTYWRLLTQM